MCSVLGRQKTKGNKTMTRKNIGYLERILVASNDSEHGMFTGILMPEVQHDTWCKQLNRKGDCNCTPNIFIETNDGRFEIDIQGKIKKIV
jgi:hypothetical protein